MQKWMKNTLAAVFAAAAIGTAFAPQPAEAGPNTSFTAARLLNGNARHSSPAASAASAPVKAEGSGNGALALTLIIGGAAVCAVGGLAQRKA